MYKLKYYSLSTEEKKILKQDFYKTEFGKSMKNRLNRLFIIGILGILFSIYLFFSYNSVWELALGIFLLIFSLLFLISSFKIRIDKLNNYLIKINKTVKKNN